MTFELKNIFKSPVLTGLFSFVLIALSNKFGSPSLRQFKSLTPPPPQIEHLHFGFREMMADSLWLRVIQDFDYCEGEIAKQTCKGNGWVYQMLVAVSKLSPHFRMPMATGPVMLSVVVNDVEGASKLFDYAVTQFPSDWPILYRAAYHAMIEEKNKAKAAKLMEQAARYGAPQWVYSLATRLYTEAGEREFALHLVKDLEGTLSPEILNRMKEHLGLGK